ncbi:NAD(P)H-binding protein [Vibrio neptunius]|uniref:NmrA family NAD(P)-binding protein n=1 Tax=Vibrio neptunius TaxID=170651 RepID=UPI0019D1A813|nr:NAD(P)H-binding protein [Vibrio neptunius]MBN3573011.1 NAD(P)H-binding protein [Vibrio neptunius]
MNTSKLYVITGATGRTGSAAAKTLLNANHRVRVIVRDASKAQEWISLGAEVAVADLSHSSDLAKAFTGADGAYIVSPPQYQSHTLFTQAELMAQCIAQAVNKAKLPKVVVLSSIGADQPTNTGWIAMNRLLETALKDSGAAVAFLRAAYFMENWAPLLTVALEQGQLPSFLSPTDRKLPMIATSDIGKIAASTLCEDWNGIRVINLEGPSSYSPNDVAAHLTTKVNVPIEAATIAESDWPQAVSQNKFSPQALAGFIEMTQGLNSGHIAFAEDSQLEHISGTISLHQVIDSLVGR